MARTSGRFASAASARVTTLSASVDWDAVTAAVGSASSASCETVPPGWFTPAEYAERVNLHRETAHRQLQAVVKSGKAETRKFRVVAGGTGRVYPVTHYRLVP